MARRLEELGAGAPRVSQVAGHVVGEVGEFSHEGDRVSANRFSGAGHAICHPHVLAAASHKTANIAAATTTRAAQFCGVVKVPSTSLVFYPNFAPADGSAHPKKVERLKRIFKKEGCDRENPNHQIPGDITQASLSAALSRSNLTRDSLHNRENPPTLFLPQGAFIRCIYGSSRVRALEELNPPDSWWTIELYVGKLLTREETILATDIRKIFRRTPSEY